MKDDILEIAEQNKKNIAEGQRLCNDIKQTLDEYDIVIRALKKTGINVDECAASNLKMCRLKLEPETFYGRIKLKIARTLSRWF